MTGTVKALVWNPFRAETPFGYYNIDDQTDRSADELKGRPPFLLTGSRLGLSRHPTLADAKAAAQADYERRILSALTASASEPAAPIVWATGKAKEAGWKLDLDFLDKIASAAEAETGYAVTCEVVEHVFLAGLAYASPVPASEPEPVAVDGWLIEDLKQADKVLSEAGEKFYGTKFSGVRDTVRNAVSILERANAANPVPTPDGAVAVSMTPEEHRLEDLKQMAAYSGPIVSFECREPYYLASCDHCGWVGSSELCGTDSFGDDSDVYCPRCHSSGADCGKVAESLSAALSHPADGWRERIEDYYARQIDWSRNTFGPGTRSKGVVEHIRKELKEIEAAPHDLSEWVDVIILAMDGFWRHGGAVSDLMPRLLAKQQKNMARRWPDWRTMSEDSAIEHDRSGDPAAPAAKPEGGQS